MDGKVERGILLCLLRGVESWRMREGGSSGWERKARMATEGVEIKALRCFCYELEIALGLGKS